MDIADLRKRLCHLPAAECVFECDEVLRTEQLDVEPLGFVLNLKAHSMRHETVRRFVESVGVCREALVLPVSDERRAFVLECLGMNLYDLGRLDELPGVIQYASELQLPDTVKAHMLILEGFYLGLSDDPLAVEKFTLAEETLIGLKNVYSQSWLQVTAASIFMRFGRTAAAKTWAQKVELAKYLPTARLIEAESEFWLGNDARSVQLVTEAEQGTFGPLERRHRSRAHYVRGLHASAKGDILEASRLLRAARIELKGEERRESELSDAINELRANLGKGREWRCVSA